MVNRHSPDKTVPVSETGYFARLEVTVCSARNIFLGRRGRTRKGTLAGDGWMSS